MALYYKAVHRNVIFPGTFFAFSRLLFIRFSKFFFVFLRKTRGIGRPEVTWLLTQREKAVRSHVTVSTFIALIWLKSEHCWVQTRHSKAHFDLSGPYYCPKFCVHIPGYVLTRFLGGLHADLLPKSAKFLTKKAFGHFSGTSKLTTLTSTLCGKLWCHWRKIPYPPGQGSRSDSRPFIRLLSAVYASGDQPGPEWLTVIYDLVTSIWYFR